MIQKTKVIGGLLAVLLITALIGNGNRINAKTSNTVLDHLHLAHNSEGSAPAVALGPHQGGGGSLS